MKVEYKIGYDGPVEEDLGAFISGSLNISDIENRVARLVGVVSELTRAAIEKHPDLFESILYELRPEGYDHKLVNE